jgi:hypothetical protein
MPKRTAEDLLDELALEAGEDEIERAASVSVEQAEKELAAAGFDVAAERTRAGAFLDDLERGAVEAPAGTATQRDRREGADAGTDVRKPDRREGADAGTDVVSGMHAPTRGRRRTLSTASWMAAAASMAIGIGTGVAGTSLLGAHGAVSAPPPPAADLAAAGHLRHEAAQACDARRWPECLAKLDRARTLDPAGDQADEIRSSRNRAVAGILGDETDGAPR